MDTLEHGMVLRKKEFPLLFNIKKNDRKRIINDIFSIGYNIKFPKENLEINENNIIASKINTLEQTIEKLIGLSNSSSRKGELGENIIEEYINQKYKNTKYKDMAQVNHSGDAWLKFDDIDNTIMLEIKNYTSRVNINEINKMQNDMITNNINWGLFLSFNSPICNYKNFDIETFNHQGKTFTIIMIANLSDDIDRIDMGLQILRKLIQNYDKDKHFPWITNKVKSDLEELNTLIKLNYQLRDWFTTMEQDIKQSLSKYYTKLRDYQLEIDNTIGKITNNIIGSMKDSIEIDKDEYTTFLSLHKDNKNLEILSKIIDLFIKNNISIEETFLKKNNEIIGHIKVQTKKIVVSITKYNLSQEFKNDDNECSLTLLSTIFQ